MELRLKVEKTHKEKYSLQTFEELSESFPIEGVFTTSKGDLEDIE